MGMITLFAIGGFAGGLDALRHIVSRLPRDFPAAICLVLHISPDSPGLIPEILSMSGPLQAHGARDGEPIEAGRIYVAPPDRHLIVTPERRVLLGHGPKENRFRPAVDPLFRSVATAYGPRAAGIILSGGLDDGAAGLAAIKKAGGCSMVQDPKEAEVPSMPRSAIRHVRVDEILMAGQIAGRMVELAHAPAPALAEETAMTRQADAETRIAAGEDAAVLALNGHPSMLTCPDCGGVMRQLPEPPLRYRCHTGHAFSSETLGAALKVKADEALWSALRALREREILARDQAEAGEQNREAAEAQIALIERVADGLRQLIDENAPYGDREAVKASSAE